MIDIETPAEFAEREGIPIVRATTHDLLSVMRGHSLMFSDVDGNPVCLRLYEAEEYRRHQHLLAEKIGTPKISRRQAADATRPLPDVL